MEYNEQDFVAPQQEKLSGTTNVADGFSKTKNPNKQLLSVGINPGRIVQVIDLGTHMESFQNSIPEPKRKIRVAFEHSHLKQKYYLEDDKLSPAMTSKENTYIFSDRSWIKSLLDTVEGRVHSIEEAKAYPLHKLLGRMVGVDIIHKQTVDKTSTYEKINSISAWNDQTMRIPESWSPEMDLHYFFIDMTQSGELIGNNFTSATFANLPFYVRKTIMQSKEAIEHKARGGKFAQNPKQENGQQQIAGPGPTKQAQSVSQMPKSEDGKFVLEMIKTDYTYQQYLDNQWTINDIINEGAAHWVAIAQPQQMSPKPMGVSSPQPMGGQAQIVQTSTNPFIAESKGSNAFEDDNDLPF